MIFNTFIRINPTVCSVSVWKNSGRSFSFQKFRRVYQNYFRSSHPKPPYSHLCQIGDPVLRAEAAPVKLETIRTADFQRQLQQLITVMRYYRAFGLAAPQIGLSWQVFAVELTERHLNGIDPKIRQIREIEPIPLTYFINPTIKIVDHTLIAFPEICGSVCGFQAVVPRAKEIEVTALDRNGRSFTWTAKGWTARIVQHELDHLNGKLFTDKMERNTLTLSIWEEVNRNAGNVKMLFGPK